MTAVPPNPKVQCKLCDTKQSPNDVCRRCGATLPVTEIVVERIVERIVEKIVELRGDVVTIERSIEVPKYVRPHVACVHCLGLTDSFGRDTETFAALKKRAILTRFREYGGDAQAAARSLRLGKTTLYRLLKVYGIDPASGPAYEVQG